MKQTTRCLKQITLNHCKSRNLFNISVQRSNQLIQGTEIKNKFVKSTYPEQIDLVKNESFKWRIRVIRNETRKDKSLKRF